LRPAAEDSTRREILEYFSLGTQIGLTGTPKETKTLVLDDRTKLVTRVRQSRRRLLAPTIARARRRSWPLLPPM
jgi:hypothetical protein